MLAIHDSDRFAVTVSIHAQLSRRPTPCVVTQNTDASFH